MKGVARRGIGAEDPKTRAAGGLAAELLGGVRHHLLASHKQLPKIGLVHRYVLNVKYHGYIGTRIFCTVVQMSVNY